MSQIFAIVLMLAPQAFAATLEVSYKGGTKPDRSVECAAVAFDGTTLTTTGLQPSDKLTVKATEAEFVITLNGQNSAGSVPCGYGTASSASSGAINPLDRFGGVGSPASSWHNPYASHDTGAPQPVHPNPNPPTQAPQSQTPAPAHSPSIASLGQCQPQRGVDRVIRKTPVVPGGLTSFEGKVTSISDVSVKLQVAGVSNLVTFQMSDLSRVEIGACR